MNWLMTLGERTRPDVPEFAECPGPLEARAVALVGDFAQLLPILRQWRRAFGSEVTAYAVQVEADDIEKLPQAVVEGWGPDAVRLDTLRGGCVKVSDYRDEHERAALSSGAHVLMRP